MIIASLIGLAIVIAIGMYIHRAATKPAVPKPSHFRQPIPVGQFRVVGHDEFDGGGEATNVLGDYATLEEAVREAAAARQLSEGKSGRRGRPTRFLVYDHLEAFVCDWQGPGR